MVPKGKRKNKQLRVIAHEAHEDKSEALCLSI